MKKCPLPYCSKKTGTDYRHPIMIQTEDGWVLHYEYRCYDCGNSFVDKEYDPD